MKIIGAVIAALALVAMPAVAQIYKWVDENGQVHYSQRPPAQEKAKQKEAIGGPRASRSSHQNNPEYCSAIQKFATKVAVNMRRGISARDMNTHTTGLNTKLMELLDTNEPVVKQVVYAVYGYRHSKMSPSSVGALIYNNCLNGSYGARLAAGDRPSPRAMGTGWPVSAGLVVTNRHVVAGYDHIEVVVAGGKRIPVKVVRESARHDLALLAPTSNGVALPPPLALAGQPARTGAQVFTIGYPHPEIMGSEPKLTSGIVNSQSGYKDDPRTYQISVALQSGNSGGPLLNMRGRVVGVVTSKLSAVKIFQATGDLPQNVNYAVKAKYLARLMRDSGLTTTATNAGPGEDDRASLEQLAARLNRSIVLVHAR